MYNVIYRDISCLDMGVLVVKRPSVPAPLIRQDTYPIPGRDGVLVSEIKNYDPIEIPVEFNFMAEEDKIGTEMRKLKDWISKPGDLWLSDDQDVFYKCFKAEATDIARTSKKIVTVTVLFTCDPYTYYNDGAEEHEIADCLYNPYDVCCPVYHITASGAFTLTVNGKTFSGTSPGELFIDSFKMSTYNSGGLKNTAVSGKYRDIYLQEGQNTISCTVAMKIIPGWREI